MDELNETINMLSNANIAQWPIEDQLQFCLIVNEAMQRLKPYLIKNEALKKESPTSYLFKL